MNKSALVFMGMGFEIVSLIMASYYLAPQIEIWFPALKSFGFVVLSVTCLIGWLIQIIVLLKRLDKES